MEYLIDLLRRLKNKEIDTEITPSDLKKLIDNAELQIKREMEDEIEEFKRMKEVAMEELQEDLKKVIDDINKDEKYKKYFTDDEGEGCPICMMSFCKIKYTDERYGTRVFSAFNSACQLINGSHPVETNCGHIFHRNCIERSQNCPICRTLITDETGKNPECRKIVEDK